MKKKVKFGLIGKNIQYSFSKKYFEEKFQKLMLRNHTYEIYDLQNITEIEGLLKDPELKGLNVTIPFKVDVIPYLDNLSDEAEKVGAVNTILIQNGKKTGHNSDVFGFEKSLKILRTKPKSALILGNGGASKAIQYVLNQQEIPFEVVSRDGNLNYKNMTSQLVQEKDLIVQCTPVGTYPNIQDCLSFPFDGVSDKHTIIDLIYNPNYTQFIKNASEKGAKTMNGFFMLEQQAEKSWQIWNS